MNEKMIINLEDLIVSSVIMYVIDKKSKNPFFYKSKEAKGESFKEHAFRVLSKKNISIKNDEYFNFDIIGEYFDEMVITYIDKYKTIDNASTLIELTMIVRDDLRFFMSSRTSNGKGDNVIFG